MHSGFHNIFRCVASSIAIPPAVQHTSCPASDTLYFILAVIFIVVPTGVMVASTMGAERGRGRNKKILLTMLQVCFLFLLCACGSPPSLWCLVAELFVGIHLEVSDQ